MQTPFIKTPLSVCVNASYYTQSLFSIYIEEYPTLATYRDQFKTATDALLASETAIKALDFPYIEARTQFAHANHRAVRAVRTLGAFLKFQDGGRVGRFSEAILPHGVSTVIRKQGISNIEALQGIENNLSAHATGQTWQAEQLQNIKTVREAYQAALARRTELSQKIDAAVALQNAAKQRFVDTYREVAARIKADFIKEPDLADLFFDDLRIVAKRNNDDATPAPGATDTPALAASTTVAPA